MNFSQVNRFSPIQHLLKRQVTAVKKRVPVSASVPFIMQSFLIHSITTPPPIDPLHTAYFEYTKTKLRRLDDTVPHFDIYQEINGHGFSGRIPNINPSPKQLFNPLYEKLGIQDHTHYWASNLGLNEAELPEFSDRLIKQIPLKVLMDKDLMIDPAEIRQGPNGEFIRLPFLLASNPDLLAALTAPYLNQLEFDLNKKCFAWLYCQDDLVVDVGGAKQLGNCGGFRSSKGLFGKLRGHSFRKTTTRRLRFIGQKIKCHIWRSLGRNVPVWR